MGLRALVNAFGNNTYRKHEVIGNVASSPTGGRWTIDHERWLEGNDSLATES